jgi:iron complex outermembrane receptor protein
VGSSFTQLADQEAGFGCIGCPGSPRFISFGNPTTNGAAGGTPLTNVHYDNELPSYQIGNLRLGVRSDVWEAALFINNIWDERAFLSLDRERGTSARVGYLTNQPRTYGLSLRMDF